MRGALFCLLKRLGSIMFKHKENFISLFKAFHSGLLVRDVYPSSFIQSLFFSSSGPDIKFLA
jgi:hypothetical protein